MALHRYRYALLCPQIYSTDLNDLICKIESAVRPSRY
jgi:hypothetical protein